MIIKCTLIYVSYYHDHWVCLSVCLYNINLLNLSFTLFFFLVSAVNSTGSTFLKQVNINEIEINTMTQVFS